MAGELVIERGSLWDLLDLLGQNLPFQETRSSRLVGAAKGVMRKLQQYNPVPLARRNAAHHYDLSYDLYRIFLDQDLQYSCAYFPEPGLPLEEAQYAKKHHIAAKLLLEPGQRVLDIGCGWGGLALSLAQMEKIEIVGVTLACEQLVIAQQRAREARLEDRVKFELRDYREIKGKFDRIVSVGMFEHVGTPHYPKFFETISGLLADTGVALIHSIGRMKGPDVTSAWIRKYIFPGGYVPALSEVMPAVERAGLWLTDLEILRLHYAQTLAPMARAFFGKSPAIARALRRTVLPNVGVLSRRERNGLPLRRHDGLSGAACASNRRRPADTSVHAPGRKRQAPHGGGVMAEFLGPPSSRFSTGGVKVAKFIKLAVLAAVVAFKFCVATAAHVKPVTDYIVANVRPWLSAPVVVNAVKFQNIAYANLTNYEINKLDNGWIDRSDKKLINSKMNNELASFLRAKKAGANGVIVEIFVFDARV